MSDLEHWYNQWTENSKSFIDKKNEKEKEELSKVISIIKENKKIYMKPVYKKFAKNVTMSIVDPSLIYSKIQDGILLPKLYKNIPKHQKLDSIYEYGFNKEGKCLYRRIVNSKVNKIDRLYAYSHGVIYELGVYNLTEKLDVLSCNMKAKYYINEKNNPLKIYRYYGALNVEEYNWINDYIAFINTGVHTYILLKNEKEVIALFEKKVSRKRLFSYRTQNDVILNEEEVNIKEQSLNGHISLKYVDIYDIQSKKTEYKYIQINGIKNLVSTCYIKPPIGFSYRQAKEIYSQEVLQFINNYMTNINFKVKSIGIEYFNYGYSITDLLIGFHDEVCDDIHSMKYILDMHFRNENKNIIYQMNDYIQEHNYYHSYTQLMKVIKLKIEKIYGVNVLLIEIQD